MILKAKNGKKLDKFLLNKAFVLLLFIFLR